MTLSTTSEEERALLALLDYYGALGVDAALDETPHDRYAESAREPPRFLPAPLAPAREPPRRAPLRPAQPPLAPQAAAQEAQALAAAANSLDELCKALAGFDGGGSIPKARHFMFSSGAPGRLMALDYAPGEAEENGGAPFSGPEARLLAAMLAAIGEGFSTAYCAYFSPWRPPGGQTLAPHASATLAPFARRHIELARPKALLLLGDSAKVLLPPTTPANLYGRRFDLSLTGTSVAVVTAPGLGLMLKVPSLKARAWRALRLIAEALAD